VKIRGFRVELGEIEATLGAEPGVRQCVVIARSKNDNPDDKQVVAYVVLDRQLVSSSDGLKAALKEKLPDYMVPAAIVEMSKLPLTTNGKVDRKALPAPEERASREYLAPATPTEEAVAQIWSDVLKVERISSDENFFDLGGHSLLATQVISRLRESMKLEIALRTMFESPVLRDFSAELDRSRASGAASIASAPIQRVARQAYRPDVTNQ
jgi:acyl carrier protein